MATFAAQAPSVVARSSGGGQSNHHHHVPAASTSRRMFDLAQVTTAADGYGYFAGSSGGGASFLGPSANHNYVKNIVGAGATTQLLPPPAWAPLRLTGREDSTRVRLQRQRIAEQHRAHIVGDRIPGFKTSAAFLSSLRTNLRLHASPPSSPMSTPPSMRGSTSSLPPPSPLAGPSEMFEPSPAPEDPLAGVPELSSYMARNDDDKIAALQLVADSVAQMRQAANTALIFHPLNLALAVGVMSLFARWVYDAKGDWSLVATSCAGVIMALLAGCRWATQGYLQAAESVDWDWLEDADVIVTRFGDEVIGTAVVEWVSGESSRQKRKKAWRGEIRAWTVRMKYRGKGVGAALLEDVVKEARKKGAESLEFAYDHANSKRVLPTIYNSKFDKREGKSRELLQDLLEASPTRGKKR